MLRLAMLVKEEAEIMKTLIKLTYNVLKEIKMFHLVQKNVFKNHLNFPKNMDFTLKFGQLYHDGLEAWVGVGGQTHQKSLKGSHN